MAEVDTLMRHSPCEFPESDGSTAADGHPSTAAQNHVQHLTSGRCWVLGLSRVNAVAAWRGVIGDVDPHVAAGSDDLSLRAVFGTDATCNRFYGSETHEAAVEERRMLLHTGGYDLSRDVSSKQREGQHTALVEVACMVVMEAAGVSLPEIIDCLLDWGFNVLAASQRALTPEVADAYAAMANQTDVSAHKARNDASAMHAYYSPRVAVAAGSRVLVLAIERDNAVTCSEMLLARGPLKQHYGSTVLSSRTLRAAEAELALFFSTELV